MEQILVKNIISQETPAIDIRSKAPTVDLALGASSAVAALTAASAAGGPVLIPAGTYLIDQDVTCSAPLFFAGGKFSIASGKTLTINGPIQAVPAQLFEGLGTVAFGQGAISTVLPQWWGALGDGVQDDAPALRKAMATGRNVYLIGGTYLMDSVDAAFNYDGNAWVLKFTNSNQKLSGGPRASIKFGAGMVDEGGQTYGAGLLLVSSVTDLEISGILFDMNGENNLVGAVGVRNCIALKVVDSNRVKIKDNHFYNCPGHNGITTDLTSYQIQIESNIFTNGGTSIPGNINQGDWSAIYCESDETVVSNNIIIHEAVPFAPAGGIEFHGSRMVGKGNIIKNSYPGIYIGGFTGHDISDLNISGNVMQDCRAGIMFSGHLIRRCNIIGNTIHLNRDQFTDYTVDQSCVGIWQHHDGTNVYATHFGSLIDCNISDNTIVQTDIPSADQTGTGMLFATVDGLMVSNNIIRNVAATGVIFRGTPWGTKNVQFIGNSIHDFGQNTTAYAHYAMQLSFGMTFTAPPDAGDTESNVWNMLIEGNSFSKTTGIAEDRTFWTMWNAASIVDGLVIRQNKYSNIGTLYETAGGYVPSLGHTAQGATASVADGGTITHGLGATPAVVTAVGSVAGEIVSVTAKSSTTFTVAIKKHDGTAGTSQTIYWNVWN